MSEVKAARVAVYIPKEIYSALMTYRGAGANFNLSKFVRVAMVDKFIEIERARRMLGEPYLFTPEQLYEMKQRAMQ